MLLLLGVALTLYEVNAKKHIRLFDIILFVVTGLLGWLLFALWTITDHNAAAKNMNLLWAIPLYFPVVFWLLRKQPAPWVQSFFLVTTIISTVTLLTWFILPQDLHVALIPITLLLVLRGSMIAKFGKLRSS